MMQETVNHVDPPACVE